MPSLVLLRKALRESRMLTISIGLTSLLMAWMVIAIYPTYARQLANVELPDAFKGFIGEAGGWTTPGGFINAEFFSWMPLVLLIIAITGGSRAIAGEEGAGTLDLLLAQPVGRTRLLLETAAGLAIACVVAALVALPGFAIGLATVDVDISFSRVVLGTINQLPVTLLVLALSLWLSAALPSRAAAAGTTSAVVLVSYLLNLLGGAVEALDGMRRVSPFYWSDASRLLVYGGLPWERWAAFALLATMFLVLAVWAANRRDLTAGSREGSLLSRLPWRNHNRRQQAGEVAVASEAAPPFAGHGSPVSGRR